MQSKSILLSLALALFINFSLMAQQRIVAVDKENSSIQWIGKKVTGGHDGHIELLEGSLELTKGTITGGSFVMDMTSITVDDIENENYNAKLVKHLKDDDFFGVDQFPSASLIIKGAQKVTSNKIGDDAKTTQVDQYKITADISIKGITKEITNDAELMNFNDNTMKASSEIIIDRSEFGIHYGSDKNLGDKMIYNNFTLKVDLALN
jgi:polyisoprenoid-binding protein YceI